MTAAHNSELMSVERDDANERAERDELVSSHLHLATVVAREVAWQVPLHMRADLRGVANIALIEAAQKYRPGAVPFGAYARQRIRGACLDSIRRRNWLNGTANQLDQRVGERRPDHAASIESRLIELQLRGMTRERLRSAVFALPSRLAVVMWMRYFEGHNHEQLAVSMGVNSSRVCQLHTEALRMLRSTLDPAIKGGLG